MALNAATTGSGDSHLANMQGVQLAKDMLSLNINTNFAPVADVNSNPLNPVINFRSIGDSVSDVSELAMAIASVMQDQRLIVAYKHFTGHGNTSTDSHIRLPRDLRSRQHAFGIDPL